MIYLAAVLETWLAPRWQVRGITPDLVALAALAWLSRSKSRYGFLMVALAGFAADLSSSAPLGLGMATAICLLQSVVLRLVDRIAMPWQTLAERAALVGLYTTAVAIPLLIVLRWFGANRPSPAIVDQPAAIR
jgi:rod shape-determining protein MreD